MEPVGPVPIGGSVLVGDIEAPPGFAPKPVLTKESPRLLTCFNFARSYEPALHGKLVLRLVVNEAGKVVSVEADAKGTAYHPKLVECLNGAFKESAKFPKPPGMATISAPLVFRP